MGVRNRVRASFRKLLSKPGTTVDLAPVLALLPAIGAREAALKKLSDDELTAAAVDLRATESDPDAALSSTDELVEICALGREAARRGLQQRPYDVQLTGAMALLNGDVAEMATGEGKTLTATIAAFGYAVRGGAVHVLTVNDYLARRDAEWMEPAYRMLGLTVGWVNESSTHEERAAAYACDVTYVSVSEAGFDYLRDQMCVDPADVVQPPLGTAIVDEADSILIDEARVPLVLAGAVTDESSPTRTAAVLVHSLHRGKHYQIAEDGRSVALTNSGLRTVEQSLGGINLYGEDNLAQLTAVNLALHAEALLKRDVDYIVRDGRVELVDEFRGRVAQRRRWPDGLQSAVEAKEGLDATAEGEVLGTITVQALINLYPNRCGMTATAVAVGDPLREFYGLEVAVISSNKPCVRVDEPDRVYDNGDDKEAALLAEIAEVHATGRPVLVGTLDVAESERLAGALRTNGIECSVLNAKNDETEAQIIAEAGGLGSVTVSTQMAGRGTDIRLGGSDEDDRDKVVKLGGLYVIGSGRHDSRRVDDQLRGRAGRQGDPGRSVFFVSLDDDLVKRHGQDAMPQIPMPTEDGRLDDPAISRAIEHAQRVSEGINAEIHRNTWRYSVLIERQRRVLAARRVDLQTTEAAADLVRDRSADKWAEIVADSSEETAERIARTIALHHLDRAWADHLALLSDVREGVHLRALGRQDPLDEFHRVAVPAFQQLLTDVEDRTVETFDEVELVDGDWAPADAGLVRPSATWTYLVQDNPFGSEMERFFTAVAKAALGRR